MKSKHGNLFIILTSWNLLISQRLPITSTSSSNFAQAGIFFPIKQPRKLLGQEWLHPGEKSNTAILSARPRLRIPRKQEYLP
jgi:hypothetical protein